MGVQKGPEALPAVPPERGELSGGCPGATKGQRRGAVRNTAAPLTPPDGGIEPGLARCYKRPEAGVVPPGSLSQETKNEDRDHEDDRC